MAQEIKILLVDDEYQFVAPLAERLKIHGFDPGIALGGETVFELLAEKRPAVIILDLKMPGYNGMEILDQIKRQYPEIQVIVLTGYGSQKDEKKAYQLGAFGYFNKPLGLDTLVTLIKRAYKATNANPFTTTEFAEGDKMESAE